VSASPRTAPRRAAALSASTVLALAGAALLGASPAVAAPGDSSATIDFSAPGYTAESGSPRGQNGWTGASDYDIAIAETGSGRALRFSNGTGTNYGNINQLLTPTIASAGEPGSGAAYDSFSYEFTVASETGDLQPGLNLEVDGDHAGNRNGGSVSLRHDSEENALEIALRWPDYGSEADLEDWNYVGVDVDPTAPHTVKVVTNFVEDGPDVTKLYVDGALAVTGGTFEAYHAANDGSVQPVDGLLFRTNDRKPNPDGIGWSTSTPDADQALSLSGHGFLFSGISYSSFDAPVTPPPSEDVPPTTTPTVPAGDPTEDPAAFEDAVVIPVSSTSVPEPVAGQPRTLTLDLGPAFASQWYYVAIYSAPTAVGWVWVGADGTATFPIPDSLPAGTHTVALVDASGAVVAYVSGVSIPALLALVGTGVDAWTAGILGFTLLLLGGAGLLLVRVRSRSL